MTETLYHIYVNDQCFKACLEESEFKKEMAHLKGFLELTNLTNSATIDYVQCEPPVYTEASF